MENNNNFSIEIQMRIRRCYRIACTCSGSSVLPSARILKEGLYDRGFLSRSRLKAHAVGEDETWILVRVVLAVDVRFSNVIMSDINHDVGLHTFQL